MKFHTYEKGKTSLNSELCCHVDGHMCLTDRFNYMGLDWLSFNTVVAHLIAAALSKTKEL